MAQPINNRPIHRAIRATEIMLNYLRMAEKGNYPPASTAQIWQAVHAHTQIKFHLDAEVSAQSFAWALAQASPVSANNQDQAVPSPDKGDATAGLGSVQAEEGPAGPATVGGVIPPACRQTFKSIQQMGIGKIPVAAV